ncbi:uncharacterized protein B0T23DRAFT_394072 [Neurospora hispaniola]|uniref:Uncharacterized protein n=1 Tax=Neurospora hispaniola TaxID=588809 RepID=A0AAJ0MUB8_9PEZI|nr:hypothetical protein B0T23DRAFT_394072 [Neurospora hispaniola]
MADPPPDPPEPQVQRIKDPPLPPFHVYAIARLAGRYRCLGGVCCPSPYEATSKESIVLFLRRTFSDASNRIPLVLELELGSDFYACRRAGPPAHSPPSAEEEEKPCFPFILTCLCVGSASLMEDARYQGWNHFGESVFPLSADEILGNCPVGCWCRSELLPEDAAVTGVSVIFVDVTDPRDIRHRFATWEPDLDPALESTTLEHLMTGWSLPRWSSDGMNNGLFTEEEKRELAFASRIELGALRETWPGITWDSDPSQQPVRLPPDRLAYAQRRDEWTMDPMVATMAQVTWGELIKYEAPLPIGRRAATRSHFRSEMKKQKGKVVAWNDAVQLLRWAYRDETFLDWACFTGLTARVLRLVLEKDPLAGGSPLGSARVLTLCPDWEKEEPKAIAEVICSPTGVRFCDVYIMTLPEQAASMETCRKTSQLFQYLAENERRPIGKMSLTGAYSSSLHERFWLPQPSSLSVTRRSPVLQFLLHNREYSPDGATGIISNTFQSYYLGDACLTPIKIVNGLLDFIYHTHWTPDDGKLGPPWGDGLRLCMCLSRASSTLDQDHERPQIQISPLPAEAYSIARATSAFRVHPERYCQSQSEPHPRYYSQLRDIDHDHWTLILVQERHNAVQERLMPDGSTIMLPSLRLQFSYCFVRSSKPEARFSLVAKRCRPADYVRGSMRWIGECPLSWLDLETTDLEGFLLDTMGPGVDVEKLDARIEYYDERSAWALGTRGDVRQDDIWLDLEVMDAQGAWHL